MHNPVDPRIIAFIKDHHVLSLSVMRENNIWAANLFYCEDCTIPDQITFIIVSDLHTKHGQWMETSPQIAGTIASQPQKIETIRGLQFTGTVHLLADEKASLARTLFYTKFPEAQGFVAPIWQINCNLLKYTDNSLGFGTKLSWSTII